MQRQQQKQAAEKKAIVEQLEKQKKQALMELQ